MDGGIFGLLGLIASHRGAVEYDWRTRFGCGLSAVGQTMTITEASRLSLLLTTDPTTQTFVAANGWAYPASREFLVLADLFDAFSQVNFKKPKPYPRPDPEPTTETFGEVIRPADMAEVMAAFGRAMPPPESEATHDR